MIHEGDDASSLARFVCVSHKIKSKAKERTLVALLQREMDQVLAKIKEVPPEEEDASASIIMPFAY